MTCVHVSRDIRQQTLILRYRHTSRGKSGWILNVSHPVPSPVFRYFSKRFFKGLNLPPATLFCTTICISVPTEIIFKSNFPHPSHLHLTSLRELWRIQLIWTWWDVEDVVETRRRASMRLLIVKQLDLRVDQQWINTAAVTLHRIVYLCHMSSACFPLCR